MKNKETNKFDINDIVFRNNLSFEKPHEQEIFDILKKTFEEIFDMFDINIFVIDELWYYHFVNNNYCKVANKSKKDIIWKHVSEVLSESEAKRYFISKDILLAKDVKYRWKYKESQPYVNPNGEAFLFDTKKFQLNNMYSQSFNTWNTRLFLGVWIDVIDLEYREEDLKNLIERINKLNKNHQDSLNHAWRIQEASLPSKEYVRSCFPESFVVYRPKNTVSGDFYWIHKTEHELIAAVGDCTGHGMSWTLLSMLGIAALNDIIKGNKIYEPSKILEELDTRISRDLNSKPGIPEKCENPPLDGIDISLCSIDPINKILTLSLASSIAYLIKKHQIIELKWDMFPVGCTPLFSDIHKKNFQSFYLPIEEWDILYLFTDWYTSQFWGNKDTASVPEKFLRRRFRDIIEKIYHLPFNQQKDIIEQTFKDRKWSNNQVDDILVFWTKLPIQ